VCGLAGDDARRRSVSHGVGHRHRHPWLSRSAQGGWSGAPHPGQSHHRAPALLSLGTGRGVAAPQSGRTHRAPDRHRAGTHTTRPRAPSDSLGPAAIGPLASWAVLPISEVDPLQMDHCAITRRSGTITIVDSKGGITRPLDLHNEARRALYIYLNENTHAPD